MGWLSAKFQGKKKHSLSGFKNTLHILKGKQNKTKASEIPETFKARKKNKTAKVEIMNNF